MEAGFGTGLSGLGGRFKARIAGLFPAREITFRTNGQVRFFRISTDAQAKVALVALVLGGWAAFSSFSYFVHDGIITAKNTEILSTRLLYRSLLSEVSDYQMKFTGLAKELEENHGRMLGLVSKNVDLQQSLRSTADRLVSTEEQHRRTQRTRAGLKKRLGEIEDEMRRLNRRNFKLKGNLYSISSNLEEALVERNQARASGERMAGLVRELKGKLKNLEISETEILEHLTRRSVEEILELEKVVAATGLKKSQLLADASPRKAGQGGPFVAASLGDDASERLKVRLDVLGGHVARLEELKQIMYRLPLAPPLNTFSISSRYGKRRDPVNRKWAMHYGLDFGGVFKMSVYATAPGIVTHAGRKGRYGKLVEISHGKGLKTRYGHLYKILVKRGQRVDYRHKIGLLGSTGRSTGSHLHYEINHRGRPKDPWKFIRAGRNVYKGQ